MEALIEVTELRVIIKISMRDRVELNYLRERLAMRKRSRGHGVNPRGNPN